MADSTPPPDPRKPGRPRKAKKPKKPYPDFPLTPHNCGAWMKKINGRIFYFGRWGRVVNGQMQRVEGDGWKEALEQYQKVADDLHAGRTPRVNWDALTVAELCNRFLTAKLRKLEAGEIGAEMFREYRLITDTIVSAFGRLRPVADLATDDFEKLRATMAEHWGPYRLGNAITRVRSVFKYGLDNGLIDRPIRYGGEFKKPDKAVLRRHRAQAGMKMLEADQLRAIIDAAGVPLRAMTLLGINCGFGNSDCGNLPQSAVNLDTGWIDFPRPKTGIPRRCPLWPETIEAIREALAARPGPKKPEHASLAFLTARGTPWIHFAPKGGRVDNVAIQFGLLLKRLGMHRARAVFYTLRHVFRTVADEAKDQPAADAIMGHESPHMSSVYRERIKDDRLRAVADYVRRWLYGGAPEGGTADESSGTAPEADDATDAPQQAKSDFRPALRLYAG
jgi:integrase